MEEKIRLALVQADLIWEDRMANLKMLEKTMENISATDLILLPEMFDSGFSMNVEKCAQAMNGPTVKWMQELAAQKTAAVAGSLIIADRGRYYNRLLFVDPDEKKIHAYDKRHLFSMASENRYYSAGTQVCQLNFRRWNISLFICYDLRFPMWTSLTAGADLMVFVANWPAKRKRAWNSLLPARAIENQCYVAGVNRVGLDPMGNQYEGESQLINYEGQTLCKMDHTPGIAQLEIDKPPLQVFRRAYPFIRDNDKYSLLD